MPGVPEITETAGPLLDLGAFSGLWDPQNQARGGHEECEPMRPEAPGHQPAGERLPRLH